jgi:hypothetical protein
MARYTVTVDISGPVFNGAADAVAKEVAEATARDLGHEGTWQIKARALMMNKSGRGGTGRAAAGVLLYDHGARQVIYGEMVEGQVWWPWLEGISKRNRSTSFKGYWTFRNTARRLRRAAPNVLQRNLDARIGEMGGTP